jgi:hypothetical protein
MLSSGLSLIWWSIVFTYFILDAGLALAYVYLGNSPLGVPMPKGFPFWYIATDTVILVFLIHLAFACFDYRIQSHLEDMGLAHSYLVFLIAASLWFVVAGLRYLSIRKLFNAEAVAA